MMIDFPGIRLAVRNRPGDSLRV